MTTMKIRSLLILAGIAGKVSTQQPRQGNFDPAQMQRMLMDG